MPSNHIYSIYLITNNINNKKYIGYTSNKIGHRFTNHCSTYQPKNQKRSLISLAIEKYGKHNFSCDVIFQSVDYEYCRSIETHFINEYNSHISGYGYNIDFGGTGHKRSESTIEKHREKIKGTKQSEEHKNKKGFKEGNDYGTKNKGKIVTYETKRNMSKSAKEQYHSNINHPFRKRKQKETYIKTNETKRNNRHTTNKYKHIIVQYMRDEPIQLDEHYQDWFKEHNLNNFMPKQIKDNSQPIKGWYLISYEINNDKKQ